MTVATSISKARGARNLTKISDIGFLKTELNQPQNSKTENSVSAVRFQKPTSVVWGWFFTLSHSQFIFQHDRINSQHNFIFFFMPYLCTSNSESLWLTVTRTNSAWKYVISSVIHTKQHTVQKLKQKPKPWLIY